MILENLTHNIMWAMGSPQTTLTIALLQYEQWATFKAQTAVLMGPLYFKLK